MLLFGWGSLIFSLLAFAQSCSAQATTFQWQFANNFVSSSIAECQNMSIVVKSHNDDGVTFGVPPYYMRAFAVGGIPTFALAGSDRNSLSWLVDHTVGSKLMLTMVDSNGSSGGVAPALYDVISGKDTSCVPSVSTTQFTVQPNISTSLETCQPWGMTIKGGMQPYMVTLAALDSPIITNVTLGPLDDVFTFIDRADPNTQLLAAVSDADGHYANGTGLVSTHGSADVSCTGLVSSSGNSTQMAAAAAAQEAANKRRAKSRRRTDIIVGVVVGLVVLILVLAAFLWFMARRRKNMLGIVVGQDTRPRLFEVEQAIPVTASPTDTGSRHSRKALLAHSGSAAVINPPELSDAPSSSSAATGSSSMGNQPHDPTHNHSQPCPSQDPTGAGAVAEGSSPPRHNKAVSAYIRASRSVGEILRPTSSTMRNNTQTPNRRGHEPLDPDVEPDIIIQHRDGGVVQELPPPYADRSAASRRR